jgi:hypothetical protein
MKWTLGNLKMLLMREVNECANHPDVLVELYPDGRTWRIIREPAIPISDLEQRLIDRAKA